MAIVLLIAVQGCLIRKNDPIKFPIYPQTYCEVNKHNEMLISLRIPLSKYNELLENKKKYDILNAHFEYPLIPSPQYHVFAEIIFADCNLANDHLKNQEIDINCTCQGEYQL